MPTTPSPAQSEASRLNGARSTGPATAEGKTRAALNGVRHGLCGRPSSSYPTRTRPSSRGTRRCGWPSGRRATCTSTRPPQAAIRAMWREIRADRLEAAVLTDLFAAGEIADDAERQAAKAAAMKALGTLLRYRGRIEREHRAAMAALDALRQRRLARPSPARPHEPEAPPAAVAPLETRSANPSAPPAPAPSSVLAVAPPSEPERPLNRHQRRALAAMARRAA